MPDDKKDELNEQNEAATGETETSKTESSAAEPSAEGAKDGNNAEKDDGVKEFKPENFEEEGHPEEEEVPRTVTVQPVQFASFEDMDQIQGPQNQNLNILLDVKLQLSVELGKTDLPIKKVLELTKGSIVTLNKAAGEPVELYANGKLIAYGEVVVIEDNFGLRITHITDPVKRLNTINSTREDY